MLRDLLILDADPDLFLDTSLQDIDFIDHSLWVLLSEMVENNHLIDQYEQLHNLEEAERQYEKVLSEMAGGQGSISSEKFPVIKEKVLLLREQSLGRCETIKAALDNSDKSPEGPAVSAEEMAELFKDTE